jgi:hypothetical protein
MKCNCGCEHLQTEEKKDIRIVILQRGWVMVGEFKQEGHKCFLNNASVIRVWGTSKGIGELLNGPTKDTKADSCGNVEFHELTVVATMKVNKGW